MVRDPICMACGVEEEVRGASSELDEHHVLELVAAGAPLTRILEAVCRLTENDIPDSVCCIALHDDSRSIMHDAVVPSLPELGIALEGQSAIDGNGACGSACARGQAVVVADIETDPLTSGLKSMLLPLGLRACWSKPMLSPSTGRVMGCFAVYFRTAPAVPKEQEMQRRDVLLRWAAIAIERWQVERALRESEEHLRYTVELSPQIPWTAEPDGSISSVSARWVEFTGYSREEALSEGWLAALHPDDHARIAKAWADSTARGEPVDVQYRLHSAADGYRWVRARAYPRRDAAGRIVRWYGVLEDIHEHKLSEDALRQEKERLRLLTDGLPVLIGYLDRDLIYRFANRAYQDWFGLPAEDIVGRHLVEVIGQDAFHARLRMLKEALSGRAVRLEGFLPHQDGHLRHNDTQYLPDIGEDGEVRGIYVLVVDTSVRRHAEEKLRQSEARLTTIFNQASVGIAQTDTQGRLLLVNGRYCEITGRGADDLIGRRTQDLIHPDDRPRGEEKLAGLLKTGEPYFIQKRICRPDGSWLWVNNHVSITRGPDGRPREIITVVQDITEQKEAEQRQYLLSREVDHRAKNMLAVVQAMLRLTRADSRESFIEAVEGRIGALARAHTALAASRWTSVDLGELARDELAAFQQSGGTRIELNGPAVGLDADATQAIAMTLHELGTNATKYGALSAPGGSVLLSWSRNTADGALLMTWREQGGPGVVAPTRTGFGSIVIRQTVGHQLDGSVELDWLPDGLQCRITIPAGHLSRVSRRETAGRPASAVGEGQAVVRSCRILVVEDDALIAMEVVQLVREMGHEVIGPAASLEAAANHLESGPVDAAILDVKVRDELIFPIADQMAERSIPVLFATGHGRDVLPPRFSNALSVRKPFAKADFVESLQGLLRRVRQR